MDRPQGNDWWQAADGKWYPLESLPPPPTPLPHAISPEVSGNRRIRLGWTLAVVAVAVSTSIGGLLISMETSGRFDDTANGTVIAFLFAWSEAAVLGGGAMHLLATGRERLRNSGLHPTRASITGLVVASVALAAFVLPLVYLLGQSESSDEDSQSGLALFLWAMAMAFVNAPFIGAANLILRRWAP